MNLATIALAIELSSPSLIHSRVTAYSHVIYKQSEKINTDPLITVAIIKHESRWVQSLISTDGEDYGLMQVRAKYSITPKERLLWGENNIVVGTYMIKSSQDYCEKVLGREPQTEEWLSCYQGSCTGPSHMCKPTHMTAVVEDYAECLATSIKEAMCETNCDLIYKYELLHQFLNRAYH